MGRTPASTWGLARFLRRAGHTTESFGYVAALESFSRISDRLRRRLDAIARRERFAVVGHSLGGLLLRDAIARVAPPPEHFVMLATPNQPPRLAYKFRGVWPFRLFTGESGQLLSDPGFYARLPVPRVPYTIIAGTAGPRGRLSPFGQELNDWLVSVSETRLSDRDTPIEIAVEHAFMMANGAVRTAVARVLATASPR